MAGDITILETAGRIAGIGGLALGVFLILFRNLLRKLNLPGLTKDQSFKVVVIFMVLVWSIAVCGLGAWVYASTRNNTDGPIRTVSFVASNEDTPFALKGRFEGEAIVGSNTIVVRLTSGMISYPTPPPAGGDASVEAIRVSLAEPFQGAWRALSVSESTRIDKVLKVGAELELPKLEWRLQIPSGGVGGRWLVFEIVDPNGNTCNAQTMPTLF